MPEPATPQLTESDVNEYEKRRYAAVRSYHSGDDVNWFLTVAIPALIRDWRALRARIETLTTDWCQCGHARDKHQFFGDHDECYECDQASPDLCCEWRPAPRPNENAALREQLADAQAEGKRLAMTTTNLTSDEREELLKQIRERRLEAAELAWMDHPPQPTWRDIDALLSLLDSQAAELYPPVTNTGRGRCRHNVPTCGECQIGEVLAHVAEKEKVANHVATRMRDKCVGKVKLLAESWARSVGDQWDERPDLSFDAAERVKAAGEIVCALESLTLDQVEQER